MATQNKDLSTLKTAFVSQLESGAWTSKPVYRSPQNKTSYIKKITVTNISGSSGTFDIGIYENKMSTEGNLYVAGGYGALASSTDGIVWTARTSAISGWLSVAYGNGVYSCVSQGGGGQYSTDGVTWTATTMPATGLWNGIAYGNGVFVAFQQNTTTAATSTDGINWTLRTYPTNPGNNKKLVFGNGIFVGASSWYNSGISTDGITWTQISLPQTYSNAAMTYSDGLFVIAINNSATAYCSTDAVRWTLTAPLPTSTNWMVAGSGNGKIILLSTGSTAAAVSLNGLNWTLGTTPAQVTWSDISYNPGVEYYSAVSMSSTTAATSTDGLTWTLRTTPSSAGYYTLTRPSRSDFGTNSYLYKGITLANNMTQSISYEIMLPPTHEIRVRSTVPMQITVMGER